MGLGCNFQKIKTNQLCFNSGQVIFKRYLTQTTTSHHDLEISLIGILTLFKSPDLRWFLMFMYHICICFVTPFGLIWKGNKILRNVDFRHSLFTILLDQPSSFVKHLLTTKKRFYFWIWQFNQDKVNHLKGWIFQEQLINVALIFLIVICKQNGQFISALKATVNSVMWHDRVSSEVLPRTTMWH